MKRRSHPSRKRPPADESRPLEWAVSHGAVEEVFQRVEAKLRRRLRRRLAGASICLGLLLAGSAMWHRSRARVMNAAVALVEPHAVLAAPRTQHLPDGSVVELRDNAKIALDFSAAVRHVVLERGEALFHVSKNPRRPFVVSADAVDVRAVGTAFAVERGSRAVDVLVTEGKVAVEVATPRGGSAKATAFCLSVSAGHATAVALGDVPRPARVQAVTQAEIDDRLDWLVPRMQLSGTPLAQVVELANQHSATRLVLVDPELAHIELSGVIRTDSTEPLLRLLRNEFGVEVTHRGDVIELRHGH